MTKRVFAVLFLVVTGPLLMSCDVQSGMTRKSLEKFEQTPTPQINVPTPEPIDPSDIINIDPTLQGPLIAVNKSEPKKIFNCDKYNRVSINGSGWEVNIKGICRQIMINGDKNKVTAAAASEIVVNGTENTVQFTKFANGKRPVIAENATPNTIEKVTEPVAGKTSNSTAKD